MTTRGYSVGNKNIASSKYSKQRLWTSLYPSMVSGSPLYLMRLKSLRDTYMGISRFGSISDHKGHKMNSTPSRTTDVLNP